MTEFTPRGEKHHVWSRKKNGKTQLFDYYSDGWGVVSITEKSLEQLVLGKLGTGWVKEDG